MKYPVTSFFIIPAILLSSCLSTQTSQVDNVLEDSAWEVIDMFYELQNKTIAVSYFPASKEDIWISSYVQNGLTTEMANAVAEEELPIRVVSRHQIDRILEEFSFQLSDIADESTQVQVGKLAGADLIITGTITKTEKSEYHLNGQIIEIETGVVLGGFKNDFRIERQADNSD